jgi:pimeloyl-ACP methyl ester carboxylesterase
VRDLTVNAGEAQLAVRDYGGAGEPLVLLHGLGRTLADWSVIGPLLAEQHRVVAFDIRGHGKSGDGQWSWDAAVSDIDAVSYELGLVARAVVGHSLGGMIGVMWGKVHPEAAGVVNLDGHGKRALSQYVGIDTQEAERRIAAAEARTKAALNALSGPLPPAMVDGLLGQQRALAAKFGAPESMFVESSERMLRAGPEGRAFLRPSPTGVGTTMLAEAEAVDMFNLYREVSCPILIIAGTKPDPGADPELMAAYRVGLRLDLEHVDRQLPNVTVELVEGGHGLLFEHPKELVDRVIDFLSVKQPHIDVS